MRTRRKVLSHDLDDFIKRSASELLANGIRQLTSRLRWTSKLYVEIGGTIHRDVSQQFTIRGMGDADPNKVGLPVVYDLESAATETLFQVHQQSQSGVVLFQFL